MRACHVVYARFPEDPRVRREVEALRAAGHEIDVVCLQGEEEPRDETVGGVRVFRVPLSSRRGGRLRYAYQYVLFFVMSATLVCLHHLRRRYDVVHVHSLPDFQVFAALVPRMAGARVILDLHEAFPEILAARFHLSEKSPLVGLGHLSERLSIWFADRVITVNETIRNLLGSRCKAAEKVVVVMNSPDVRTLKIGDVQALRQDLGLIGRPTLVYVGGINRERDLGTLLRAAAAMDGEIQFHLVIAGSGDPVYAESIYRLAAQLGLADRVAFLPRIPQDQVLTYLSLSEFGVVPYEDNPLTRVAVPTKAFEYAAVGKPMAISDLPALRTTFGGAAEFFKPGDPEALVAALRKLRRDRPHAESLANRARDILAQCSWDLMTRRMLDSYESLEGS